MPTSVPDCEAVKAVDDGPRFSSPPKYTITRGEDYTLQWEPPIKSRELSDALSYHYPLEQTLQQKMQRAILDFFNSEHEPRAIPEDDGQRRKPAERNESPATPKPPDALPVTDQSLQNVPNPLEQAVDPFQIPQRSAMCGVWDFKTGKVVTQIGRKQALTPTRRQEVAENRGNACEDHRKAKTRCDPTMCRQNKLYRMVSVKPCSGKGNSVREQESMHDILTHHPEGGDDLPNGLGKFSNHPSDLLVFNESSPCRSATLKRNRPIESPSQYPSRKKSNHSTLSMRHRKVEEPLSADIIVYPGQEVKSAITRRELDAPCIRKPEFNVQSTITEDAQAPDRAPILSTIRPPESDPSMRLNQCSQEATGNASATSNLLDTTEISVDEEILRQGWTHVSQPSRNSMDYAESWTDKSDGCSATESWHITPLSPPDLGASNLSQGKLQTDMGISDDFHFSDINLDFAFLTEPIDTWKAAWKIDSTPRLDENAPSDTWSMYCQKAPRLVSMDELTALIHKSSLTLTGTMVEVYSPENACSTADIVYLDDPNDDPLSMHTLDLLRDSLTKERSTIRLFRFSCQKNLQSGLQDCTPHQPTALSSPRSSWSNSLANSIRSRDACDSGTVISSAGNEIVSAKGCISRILEECGALLNPGARTRDDPHPSFIPWMG